MGLRGAPSEAKGETIRVEPYVARRHTVTSLWFWLAQYPPCGRVFRTPPRRHSMTSVMTSRRQGQTQKPNVPKKGQARGGGYGRGLASQNTQHAIEREHTQLEYWQWGEILVDPFAARAPHQLIDSAATHSTLITTTTTIQPASPL